VADVVVTDEDERQARELADGALGDGLDEALCDAIGQALAAAREAGRREVRAHVVERLGIERAREVLRGG
jgi:hypothetical protein